MSDRINADRESCTFNFGYAVFIAQHSNQAVTGSRADLIRCAVTIAAGQLGEFLDFETEYRRFPTDFFGVDKNLIGQFLKCAALQDGGCPLAGQ